MRLERFKTMPDNFKTVTFPLPWTEKSEWTWPAGDEKLVQVFDWVSDIDVIMECVEGREVCVQAGGACGIWPLRFSQFFETVYTFEPEGINFDCLEENCQGVDNIVATHAPLANDNKKYAMSRDYHERQNYGAGYVVPKPTGEVRGVKIDDLGLDACDLIQLDVEGFELVALFGGAETIAEYHPTIVLEQKPLNHDKGDPMRASKWLMEQYGYKVVAKVHKDVILC